MALRLMVPLVLFTASSLAVANEAPQIDFAKQVRPILNKRCVSCHGALRQEGGLRLDAAQLVRKGGDSGAGIVTNDPSASRIMQIITSSDAAERMPKEADPLPADEIAAIRRWIESGAVADDEAVPPDPRRHWSFLAPQRPLVPSPQSSRYAPSDEPAARNPRAKDTAPPAQTASGEKAHHAEHDGDLVASPIDAFLEATLREKQLAPLGPAPKHVLLRRIHLDLIGFPPTPGELSEFLADDSPDAYEKAVDRLLANPHYGERWGRHWMDVWRYSDWYGYAAELRNSQRHIWRWRDWIVESLNSGKPYDRMIVEMLAADEVAPLDNGALRATGFLARNYYIFNRDKWLDETVEHTAKAFLGLTVNCARCHHHMFDPISQQAYYEFRAIFEPYHVRTDRRPGQADTKLDGLSRTFDKDLAAVTYLYVRGNDKHPDKEHPLKPAVPEFLLGRSLSIEPVKLPPEAKFPGLQSFIQHETLTAAKAALTQHEAALEPARQKQNAARAALEPLADSPADALAPFGPSPEAAAASWTFDETTLALRLAEAHYAEARANLDAIETRIAADVAQYGATPAPEAAALATKAAQTQRHQQTLVAAREVLQHELTIVQSFSSLMTLPALRLRTGSDFVAKEKTLTGAIAAKAASLTKLEQARKAEVDKANDAGYTSLTEAYPAESTGRRLALARWIVDPQNPLTARVAVNHVWLRHFGQPLVESVFDFGHNGKKPTHPELLDWLACELMEQSRAESRESRADPWEMKRLHRSLVTSAAYRRDSSGSGLSALDSRLQRDPDNKLLWRMNPRRLESEAVRDSVLFVADGLDDRQGGPELDAKQGLTTHRRSLYYCHAPEKSMEFLSLFDAASTTECYKRDVTVVPQQALALANSSLSVEMSQRLARRLSSEVRADSPEDRMFIRSAFTRILGREPSSEEQAACAEFLASQPTRLGQASDAAERVRANLVHVLINHNDFVTVR